MKPKYESEIHRRLSAVILRQRDARSQMLAAIDDMMRVAQQRRSCGKMQAEIEALGSLRTLRVVRRLITKHMHEG